MSHQDRRATPRHLRNDAVAIQIQRPDEGEAILGKVLVTRTRDVSAEGLRIGVEESLEEGNLYDLCVDVQGHLKHFLLTAEVRWCRPDPEGGFEVGLQLLDGDGTDFAQWTAFLGDSGEP